MEADGSRAVDSRRSGGDGELAAGALRADDPGRAMLNRNTRSPVNISSPATSAHGPERDRDARSRRPTACSEAQDKPWNSPSEIRSDDISTMPTVESQ